MLKTFVSNFLTHSKPFKNRAIFYERCCADHNKFYPKRLTSTVPENKNEGKDSFTVVYKFPPIQVCASISKLKVYQTALTVVSCPISIYLHCSGISENIHVPIISVGIAGCIAFYSVSYLMGNVVGAVYMNKKADLVKISFLNFWGKRVDIICSQDDILPLPENNRKKILPTATVKRHSSSDILYLPTEHGIITNQFSFDEIFFKVQSTPGMSVRYHGTEKPKIQK